MRPHLEGFRLRGYRGKLHENIQRNIDKCEISLEAMNQAAEYM